MKIRWGVMSTANIGKKSVIPAMLSCKKCSVSAIASRDLAKAQEVGNTFNIPKRYGSYEELLADPEIDAVYIPLPNHLHVHWSIEAIRCGKHVLCEKPIGLDTSEALKLQQVSAQNPHIKVMEAFMYRFHPQWQAVRGIIDNNGIGKPRSIQTVFSYYNVDPANVRNIAGIGGGALLDIGCYCISVSRFIFDDEPKRVYGSVEYDPVFKTDVLTSGVLEFQTGSAVFTCSSQLYHNQYAIIHGTEGTIKIDKPFNPPPDKPVKIIHRSGSETKEILIEGCNQYILQVDNFSASILENKSVPTNLKDAVANMRVIDAIIQSGKAGTSLVLD